MQTTTQPPPVDLLPAKYNKLALRVKQVIESSANGRATVQVYVTKSGRVLIVVDDGRVEDLGE